MPQYEFTIFTKEQVEQILEKPAEAQRRVVKYTAQELMGNLKKEAPVDTGKLQGSFFMFQQGSEEFDWYIGSSADYALSVNDGAPPGDYDYGPIAAWAERHGLNPGGVFHNICAYGTAPNEYIDRGIVSTRGRVEEFFQRACAEAMGGS
jgi:hypothetical protein